MKIRYSLLALLVVSALGLTRPSHATGTTTHGQDHAGTTHATQSGSGASGDVNQSASGNLASGHHASSSASPGRASDCDTSSGLNPHIGGCNGNSNSRRSGGDSDASGGNAPSGLGWQSLLPGSIQ